jgi:hypothetical protein
MATIEEMIKNSSCFGVAFDGSVRECKICEVKLKCESKCRLGGDSKPASVNVATADEVTHNDNKKATNKKSVPVKEAAKPKAEYTDDMPDFKSMSADEIEQLAEERGIDMSQFEKYKAANIRRMRVTMALKKTYEK